MSAVARRTGSILTASLLLFACTDTTDPAAEAGSLSPTPEPGGVSAPALAVTSNTWQTRRPMPSDRQAVMTATVDNPSGGSFVYAIGGRALTSSTWCGGSLLMVQAYDGNTNTWSTKASLPTPLQKSITGVINRKIYVMGGCGFGVSRQLYVYDVGTNRWSRKTAAPGYIVHGVGSVVAGKLFVLGGCHFEWCTDEPNKYFGAYDPATDQWTAHRLPTDPSLAGDLLFNSTAASTFSGKFYVLFDDGRVYFYNPSTGAWKRAADSPARPSWPNAAAAVVKGKWYIVGSNHLMQYDPAANVWRTKTAPPQAAAPYRVSAGRVYAGGIARLELVGGWRPGNNWQYTP